MKYTRFVCGALLAVSLAVASTPEGKPVDWNKAEQNYIAALKIDNAGVQASAAENIRKYKLCNATQELKALLTTSRVDNVKMSAALTLISVCGNEGRTAVEEALQKEDSELVAVFYRSILHTETTLQN